MSYIVPKERPKCYNCQFRTNKFCGLLTRNDRVVEDVIAKTVSEYCPLVEIKEPHGRLGDLDEIKSKFRHSEGDNDADSAWISTIRRAIEQAETIVEAEGR